MELPELIFPSAGLLVLVRTFSTSECAQRDGNVK